MNKDIMSKEEEKKVTDRINELYQEGKRRLNTCRGTRA